MDIRTSKSEIELKGHTNFVRKILLSPTEKEALTCSSDHTVRLWDLSTRKIIDTFNNHQDSVFALRCNWEQEYL
jgi:WD repeat-containing protein 48